MNVVSKAVWMFRRYYFAVVLLSLVSVVMSQPNIRNQLDSICRDIKATLPVVGMIALLLAATVFAGGQVLGAETRAKMNVYATALLTAGIIGIAIGMLAPHFLGFIVAAGGTTGITTLTTAGFC